MKGFSKGIIIFSAICFILGIILCISGVIIGARFSDIFDKFNNSFIDFGELSENDLTFSKTYTGVENVELDISYGSVSIINNDSDEFKVDIMSNSKYNSYSCYLENGTLKLKTKTRSKLSFGSEDMVIKLYVPQDIILEKFNVEIGACDFNIDNIFANKINLSVGAGNLSIKRINAEKCKIECGMGNIDIRSVDIKDSIDIECGMGSVNAVIFGDKDEFNYNIDCALGNVNIAGQSSGAFINSINNKNNRDKDIKIDCGLGNVDISFIDD